MKVTFAVPELQKRLSQLSSVVKGTSPEPVYEKVRIFTDEKGIVTLQGIDIDATLTVKLPSAVADGPINLLLSFEAFNGVVQLFKAPQAIIAYENEAVVNIQQLKFRGKLNGQPSDKFQELGVVVGISERPEIGGYTIGLPGLKEQIEHVDFAVPKGDGKFVVPSARLESTVDALKVIATDGVRIAISTIPANLGEFAFTLPKKVLDYVKKLDGGPTVTIAETEGAYYFTTELEVLTHSKTHAEFPPYHRVIPKVGSLPSVITLKDKGEFFDYLKLLMRFSDSKDGDNKKAPILFTAAEGGTVLELRAIHEEKATTGDIFTDMADATFEASSVGPSSKFKLDANLLQPFFERAAFPVSVHSVSETSVVDIHANGGSPEKPTYRLLVMPMRAS